MIDRRSLFSFCVLMVGCAAQFSHAQDKSAASGFPNKPIRIYVSPAGSGSDLMARLVSQRVGDALGQPVVVENRAMVVSTDLVAKAPPDGHALLFATSSVTIGSLMQNPPYELLKVFAPVTVAASTPSLLVVHPSLPVKSVKGLIALARSNPGALNYASSGLGGASHIAAELFNSMAGVKIVRVNFKGGPIALNSMISGEVGIMFATSTSVMPHVSSGRLKALALTSAKPSALVPNMPTISDSGLPGYEATQSYTLLAPARTPAATIHRLNHEIVLAINQPESKKRLLNAGAEPMANTAEESEAMLRNELARMRKLVNEAGIRGE